MDVEIGGRDYTRALRRAHERRDIDLALGLYDERARVRLVGRGAPPDRPEVFEGKERIAEYLRETYLGGWTPRVGYSHSDVVEGDGRVVLSVAYVGAEGTPALLASETYVVSGGKIVDQLSIEARGGGEDGPPPQAPAITRASESFFRLPTALVLVALWAAGAALLGLAALALYSAAWVLVWSLAGSV